MTEPAPLFATATHRYLVMCGHCGRLKHFARGDWRHPWQTCAKVVAKELEARKETPP